MGENQFLISNHCEQKRLRHFHLAHDFETRFSEYKNRIAEDAKQLDQKLSDFVDCGSNDELRLREIEIGIAMRSGRIDCAVSKDLSRFSRNYIDAGNYLEKIFPAMGIRYIAINDNYDSMAPGSSTDVITLPFKNLVKNKGCLGKVICCFSYFRHVSAEQPHRLCVPCMGSSVA